MYKIPKLHIYSIVSLLILSFALTNYFRRSTIEAVLIDGDGSGHYSWLPSIFILKTLDFKDVFESEKLRKGPSYQGHNYHDVNGTIVNKFPPGTAILIMPFFIIALLLSHLFGMPVDGYSLIFQYSVGIAALFWAIVGLLFSYRLLLTYKIKHQSILLIVVAAFFGTNLLAYTFLMPAFSHVYSFALISILLYFTRIYFLKNTIKSLVISSLTLGIIFTVRPVNILILLFLPFLASNSKCFADSLKSKFRNFRLIYAIIAFIITLSPYFIINYLQTGSIYYDAYSNEGFYWTHPQVLNFLFSFRKGWFIYTPFMLLIFPALWSIFKKNKFEFYWFVIFITVLIYVFSSWWNWFYGDSFGMRPMVDFTVIYVLLISLFVCKLKGVFKSIALIFIILTISLNALQSYQYVRGIIHPDAMNSDAYAHVFLKLGKEYSGDITGGPEYYYGKLDEKPFYKEFNDFENDYPNWDKLWTADTQQFYSGSRSLNFSKERIYSTALNWKIPDSLLGKRNIYVKIECMVFEAETNAAKDALFIMDIQDQKGKTVFYKTANLKQIPSSRTNNWYKMNTAFKLPYLTEKHSFIKIYIWNKDKTEFLIDDFKIEFYEYW